MNWEFSEIIGLSCVKWKKIQTERLQTKRLYLILISSIRSWINFLTLNSFQFVYESIVTAALKATGKSVHFKWEFGDSCRCHHALPIFAQQLTVSPLNLERSNHNSLELESESGLQRSTKLTWLIANSKRIISKNEMSVPQMRRAY